jgi:hypothetical protein
MESFLSGNCRLQNFGVNFLPEKREIPRLRFL